MNKFRLAVILLFLIGNAASAQVNLLPQGSFQNPGLDTGWAQGFNIPNNQEARVVLDNGKHCLRLENHDPNHSVDYVHAYVKMAPQVTSLTVSVSMKTSNLKVGKEGWHDARVAMSFEGVSAGFPADIPELNVDSDWVTRTVELKVPKGATRLNIQPALFFCTGVFELTDLTVTPHLATLTQLGDAVLPPGMSLDWNKSAVTAINTKRTEASLDGIWHFIPADTGSAAAPTLGWGYLKVPGDWQKPSDFLAMGGGPRWDLYDGSRIASAWYERQAPIPAEWRGRVISLRFDRVSTDAIVYVNGTECGNVSWPWGSVDITRAVTPGKPADIRVLVAAIPDSGSVGRFMQNAFLDVTYTPATLASRGLTGSVYLESRQSEARVSDVFVRPSTRKKEISLDVDLAGVTQAGQAHLVAEMLNEKGVVEKSFSTDVTVKASPMQTLTVSWPWQHPRLWDIDQPDLYTLRLTVTGAGMDDQFNQEFGFREFWIEGRQFYLNGTLIHLRGTCFIYGPIGQVGDNFSEIGSWTPDARGEDSDAGTQLDEADHKGYLAAVPILDSNRYMMNSAGEFIWQQNQQRALERADLWMRHYRNHPAVVMWVAGFNFANGAMNADPRFVGRSGWAQYPGERWQQILAANTEMFAGLKKLDPTRSYYSHGGGDTGDFYTINCYLDLIPLQERDEWLSAWSKNGDMPLGMCEFGTPVDCTFRRGHDGFTSNITSEPLLTEYAAIYFGTNAYTSEEPKYRQFLHDLFRSGMLYGSSENRLDDYADMHKIQQLFRKQTWDSWRTAGLGGGLRTWSWMQDELKDVNFPTLAWIAGPTGAYTAKDHHFNSGQRIEKQIVLINDTRQPQDFTAAWTAAAAGKQIGQGTLRGRLNVSEIRFIPIRIVMPAAAMGRKVDGQISLTAAIGQAVHRDQFSFRVFGIEPPARGTIALIDREGATRKMLAALRYTTRAWNGGAAQLVVVGRNALKADPRVAARLDSYVRGGGRAILFAQDPAWLAHAFGWRICPDVSRRVFPVEASPGPGSASHRVEASVTRGIDSDDLRDWNGSSTLIEPYPVYKGSYLRGNEGDQPYAGWHWGNRGGVTSAAIEKPHRSGWRPLLECEFDLAYSPLMELDYGKGRLILCTLDLEDHVAVDPAARRMARRVVDYALHCHLSPRVSRVMYLGGPAGAAWLDRIGVSYVRSTALDPDAGLLLIGPDAAIEPAALRSYLHLGGRAFFLPRSQSDGGLGVALKPGPADFAGSLSVPDWPEAKGLSASDLRWRSHLDGPARLVNAGAEVGADGLLGREVVGKGVAIFCQVDPDRFHADEKTYFRYTRWRSTRAVADLLSNLGASFAVDRRIFHPRDAWGLDLNGAWQTKVTLKLPPAASDAVGYRDPGISPEAKALVSETAPAAGWTPVTLPGMVPFFEKHDGEAVFRKEVDVPKGEAGKDMDLALGALDDFDNTYFNGVEVGHTGSTTPGWWQTPRYYRVPGKLVKAGRNIIAVRLFDRYGSGGFAGGAGLPTGDQSGHQATGAGAGLPMSLKPRPVGVQALAYYYPDYRTDFPMGDNPYRYYRW